jgi:ATP-binding cassette, subfamily A (ABC1), member 3
MYLDKIMPKDFGRSEPWNFLCKSKTKLNSSQVAEAESQNPDLVSKGNFEGDAEYLKRGESLKIRQLRKNYANGFTAV